MVPQHHLQMPRYHVPTQNKNKNENPARVQGLRSATHPTVGLHCTRNCGNRIPDGLHFEAICGLEVDVRRRCGAWVVSNIRQAPTHPPAENPCIHAHTHTRTHAHLHITPTRMPRAPHVHGPRLYDAVSPPSQLAAAGLTSSAAMRGSASCAEMGMDGIPGSAHPTAVCHDNNNKRHGARGSSEGQMRQRVWARKRAGGGGGGGGHTAITTHATNSHSRHNTKKKTKQKTIAKGKRNTATDKAKHRACVPSSKLRASLNVNRRLSVVAG